MIVVKHYKTDLLLWNTDKTTCTLENTTENEPLCSVQHYRLVLEYGRVYDKVIYISSVNMHIYVAYTINCIHEDTLSHKS